MSIFRKSLITFLSATLLVLLNACSNSETVRENQTIKMDTLVSTQWLSEHLNDPNLVILDATVLVQMKPKGGFNMTSGKEQFEKEHIPNAGFADLLGNLSATDTDMEFVMPSAEQFRVAIGELGIDNDTQVVLYDTVNQAWPARLWWMLKWAGHENVAILDGGMQAWKAEARPLSNKQPKYVKKSFKLNLKPEIIAGQNEVLAAINNDQVVIVDALSEFHYTGQFSLYPRAGHITTAINLDSAKMIDEAGKYVTSDEVQLLFNQSHDKRIITYCGGGVAAASTAFALVKAGYKNVAVYMGSLQEWVANPKNPMSGAINKYLSTLIEAIFLEK
ncbi:MAG: sulfurtransferase [Proteobacteria bacterium]|nr:sulfurtransferase [Pseudomonadota bacterium]